MSLILITGGQRSGKSQYAERLALSLSPNPVYMATAHVWDEEFHQRVLLHQERRGPEWTNIEEERQLSRHDVRGRVVLVDCLTLWATNFFYADGQEADVDTALGALKAEFDSFVAQEATFVVVTNEIGWGGTPVNDVQRRFTDLLGWLNQYVASLADEVVMMVCGVPVTVKGEGRQRGRSDLSDQSIRSNQNNRSNLSTQIIQSPPIIQKTQNPQPPLSPTALRQKIDNLNKPKGSLGQLEELAFQVGMIQQTLSPTLQRPVHLLFGADHGIEQEGVSVSPRCITWQQMQNFTRGGGGVNMFCRQHGFVLRLIDVGVDHDLSDFPEILNRKIVPHGTANFLHGPAMTETEMERCLAVGREQVQAARAMGSNVLSIGEMGIANTSPSSIWMSLLLHLPLEQCVGAGAGLNSEGIRHKLDVLRRSIQHMWQSPELKELLGAASGPEDISKPEGSSCLQGAADIVLPDSLAVDRFLLRYFGGFEMVAAVGAMLEAVEQRMVLLVDGFIMTACALMASRLVADSQPDFPQRCIFCHSGDESGHRLMLDRMGAHPLLSLGLRLGEGTGALCAYPLVDSAVRMLNEMGNFQDNHITKYF